MALGGPGRRQEPLKVGAMAAALAAAALAGAVGGLLWQELTDTPAADAEDGGAAPAP